MNERNGGGYGPEDAAGRVAVVYRPIAELKLDPHNPRVHSPRQIRGEQLIVPGRIAVTTGYLGHIACIAAARSTRAPTPS